MFRNVSTSPDSPIDVWPHEVFRAILEYGEVDDLQIVANHVIAHPWSPGAITFEEVLSYLDDIDIEPMPRNIMDVARRSATQ